jgi:hypothetical protein
VKRLVPVLVLLLSHALVAAAGFAAGVYLLPVLIAPAAPSAAELERRLATATYRARLRRDLAGSDMFHWGDGDVGVGPDAVTLKGRLAPGPDYKLYLVPEAVETGADFERLKARAARVGDVRTFDGFVVPLPPGVDPAAYTAVVVWCETFGRFISAARYR